MEPLPQGLKAFNQRLLAEHCVTQERAEEIWKTIADRDYEMGENSLSKGIARSNRQLRHVGLEIKGISVKVEGGFQRHYALINKHNDEIAKITFQKLYTPGEHAFVKHVFQTLAEGAAPRSTLINLKNNIDEGVTMDEAEKLVLMLEEDKWIQAVDGEQRRTSMQAKLTLAPRSYIELRYLLVDEFGFEKDDLPQPILLT